MEVDTAVNLMFWCPKPVSRFEAASCAIAACVRGCVGGQLLFGPFTKLDESRMQISVPVAFGFEGIVLLCHLMTEQTIFCKMAVQGTCNETAVLVDMRPLFCDSPDMTTVKGTFSPQTAQLYDQIKNAMEVLLRHEY